MDKVRTTADIAKEAEVERRDKLRPPKFTERISMFMVRTAAFGAFFVLLDIKFTTTFMIDSLPQTITLGSGFSAELKGAVVTLIIVGGYVAVKEFWLGSSAAGQAQQESLSRIAEVAIPAAVTGGTEGSGGSALAANTAATATNTAVTAANTEAVESQPPVPTEGDKP